MACWRGKLKYSRILANFIIDTEVLDLGGLSGKVEPVVLEKRIYLPKCDPDKSWQLKHHQSFARVRQVLLASFTDG